MCRQLVAVLYSTVILIFRKWHELLELHNELWTHEVVWNSSNEFASKLKKKVCSIDRSNSARYLDNSLTSRVAFHRRGLLELMRRIDKRQHDEEYQKLHSPNLHFKQTQSINVFRDSSPYINGKNRQACVVQPDKQRTAILMVHDDTGDETALNNSIDIRPCVAIKCFQNSLKTSGSMSITLQCQLP
jgi:hypothetical protein